MNDLLSQNRLCGTIQGRQDKASFIPDIYSRTQNAWVDAFYQQNGYFGKNASSFLMYLCKPKMLFLLTLSAVSHRRLSS